MRSRLWRALQWPLRWRHAVCRSSAANVSPPPCDEGEAAARPKLNVAFAAFSSAGIALLAGACGMPAQFGFSGHSNRTDANSIDLISAVSTGAFTGADLAVANAATTTLLDRRDGGPWENPATGARGTITPLAAVYRDNGIECRDFLASYVHEGAEAWMQGEACRDSIGHWEVRSLKPWRR